MSIESITERIRNDAVAYSVEQKAFAEAARQKILDDANKKVQVIKAEYLEKSEQDAKRLISRRASVADLEARKLQLAAKQEVINESFERALLKIRNFDADQKLELIKSQLAPFYGEEAEVMINAEDKALIGDRLVKELEGTGMVLSDTEADIEGGCVLKKGDVYINSSIETLIESVKQELTLEIAGILFK